jgi:hypothetical protein
MASVTVDLHPAAEAEALATRRWYHERNPQVSEAFFVEFDSAISAIAEAPRRWPIIYSGYRRFPMRNFPFNTIYLEVTDSGVVMAVAHHRRRPGYWLSRK